ncbi:MAG: pectinesterase family protein [Candidatus Coproplasma sp.]
MKNIKRKSIIAIGLTALSALALGVGAIVLNNSKESPSGFKGTYDFSAYAATAINKITVAGEEVAITDTATFTSNDDAKTYTLCLTVVDMADFGKSFTTPLHVGYKIAEGGKYYNGVDGNLSSTVYSSLTFADDTTLTASELSLGFSNPYFVVAEVSTSSVKLSTPECIVAAESGFEVVDEHMDHVYLVGESLDTANLVVNSTWSYTVDEETITVSKKLDPSAYTVDTVDTSTAGEKNVSISYGTYAAKSVAISVLGSTPTVTDGRVSVNVSADSAVHGVCTDSVYTFKSVKDAIDFYEKSNLDSGVYKIISVGEGTYKDKITTDLNNLVLIGQGSDKSVMTYSAVESTIDPVNGTEYGLKCATLHVTGDNFKAYNITIRNDFDYINEASKYTSPQGVALTVDGDGAVIYNTHLYGNQDTLYLKSGRSYFYQSQIDGNVDFIFGNTTGLAYFEECTIMAISRTAEAGGTTQNGYVTAAKHTTETKPDYGYIFDSCTLTDDGKVADGAMALGRPWGEAATVAYINCSFSAAYATSAYGSGAKTDRWCAMNSSIPTNADFCEYGSTGDGAITEAVTGGKVLTAEEAANYTKANIFAATNGNLTATKFDWETEYNKLRILAGLDEGDMPEETTKTVNLKDETLTNGSCITDINTKYGEILTWTGAATFETAKPTNGVKVGTDTVITLNIVGEVTVAPGYELSAADYIITYKDGKATIKMLAITGTYGDFIGSIVIDTTKTPEDTQVVTITIDYNDGETADGSLEAVVGLPLGKPADPVRAGYKFIGWQVNGSDYDFTANVEAAFTLVAQWESQSDIDLTAGGTVTLYEFTTGTLQGSSGVGEYRGIIVDATTGKFAPRSNDVQINAGVKIKFKINSTTTADQIMVTFTAAAGDSYVPSCEVSVETIEGETYAVLTLGSGYPSTMTVTIA